MTIQILTGDCRDVLKTLPDNSVHCCVTSPPYWGLRSYLPADHDHKHLEIGSEPTLQQWVETMVAVFREVRRVLRPDGTLWLNLGDAYAGNRSYQVPDSKNPKANRSEAGMTTASRRRDDHEIPRNDLRIEGLKPKDLMGQPWRVAFALQADGWWLRQEVIWAKPNPMPESTRDRCTKAHEHVFLLSKSERYFYNFDAMQESVEGGAKARAAGNKTNKGALAYAAGDEKHRTKVGLVAHSERVKAQQQKTPSGWDTRTGQGDHGLFHSEGRDKPTPLERPTSHASRNMGRGPGWRAEAAALTPKAEAGAEVGYAEGKAARMSEIGTGELVDTRNPRSVWTIATHPFKGAHFATFPPELATRCITAGTSQIGCCPHCGAPWLTLTESAHSAAHDGETDTKYDDKSTAGRLAQLRQAARERGEEYSTRRQVIGEAPSCDCADNEPTPCTVLDPFGGSGTVGLVADRQHKHAILIDLDERNAPMATARITGESPLFAEVQS